MIISTDHSYLKIGSWQSQLSRNEVLKRFPDKRSWWIDSSGEIFDADKDHEKFIGEHSELFDPNDIFSSYQAVKRFWVRVSLWGPSFTINARDINQAQLDACQDLYMREGYGKKVEFFQEGIINTSFDKEEFLELQNVNQLKRMRSVSAASPSEELYQLSSDKRSWYVDNKGKVYDAGIDHARWREKHPKLDISDWVRVGFIGGELVIQGERQLFRGQVESIQEIGRSLGNNLESVFISIRDREGYISVQDFFAANGYVSLVRNMVRGSIGSRSASSPSDEWKKQYSDKRSWWVNPQGKIFDVGHDHNKFLEEHPKIFGKYADLNDALTMNWVRVAFWGGEYVVHCHNINRAQLAACQEIYKSIGGEHKIFVAILGKTGYISPHNFTWAESQTDLIRNLFEDATGIRASAADLLKEPRVKPASRKALGDDRAWLISPQGEIYSCGFLHNGCGLRNKELLRAAQKIDPKIDEGGVVYALVNEGWARVGYFEDPSVAYLDAYFVTGPIFRKFKEMLISLKLPSNTKVTVRSDEFLWRDFKFFDSMTDVKKFLRYNLVGSFSRQANGSDRAWLISPKGELVNCGYDHNICIWDNFEFFGIHPNESRAVEKLVDRDWTKVGILGRILYFECKRTTQKILGEIQSFVLKDSSINDVQVIDHSLGGEALEMPRDEFLQMNKASDLRWMFNVRGSRRAATEDRAWLISPNGKVINCGRDHEKFVIDNRKAFEKLGYDIDSIYPLVEDGWARVGLVGNILYIECNNLTEKYFDILHDLTVKFDPPSGVQVVVNKIQIEFTTQEFKQLENKNQVLRYRSTGKRIGSLPKSRNFLVGVDLDSMPWPLRQAFDLLNLSGKKDKLSANQVASVFQANDEFLQDHLGRTSTELIRDLNYYFQYGHNKKQTA